MSKGKKNIYECHEGHQTVTIDTDQGTTPMFMKCCVEGCGRDSKSHFYNVDQTLEPTYEWYAPKPGDKVEKHEQEHVSMGGLLLRKIEIKKEIIPEQEPEWDIQLEGVLNYKILLTKTGLVQWEANMTLEGRSLMILSAIDALNDEKKKWPQLENMAKHHPNKLLRDAARDSMPSPQNKMLFSKAIHELEKIRNSILRILIEQNTLKEEKKE